MVWPGIVVVLADILLLLATEGIKYEVNMGERREGGELMDGIRLRNKGGREVTAMVKKNKQGIHTYYM